MPGIPAPVTGLAATVLGSGCPFVNPHRVSSSYLHSFDGFGIDARPVPSDPDSDALTPVLDLGDLRVTSVAVRIGPFRDEPGSSRPGYATEQ